MRTIITILFSFSLITFSINSLAQQATLKVSTKTFHIPNPENKDWYSISSGNRYFGVRDGGVYYTVGNIEHYILNPSDTIPTPPVHFIKKDGEWKFEGYYPEGAMDFFRNYVIIDSLGTIAIASHGNEIQHPWPHGDLFLVRTIGDSLQWTKVNKKKSFYHSLAAGDINYDGLVDVIGVHQQTYTDWYSNIHPYLQQPNGEFIEDREIIPDNYLGESRAGATALFIADIIGDSHVEIVQVTNNTTSWEHPERRFVILGFDESTKRYKVVYEQADDNSAFATEPGGSTSMQVADFNNDGLLDLSFTLEKGVQIFENDGHDSFVPKDFFIFSPDLMTKGEHMVFDVDNDGWKDIVLQPYGWGNLNKIKQYQNGFGMYGTGFKLNYYIWKNNHGHFEFTYAKENLNADNMFLGAFKANMINGKLKFAGFGHMQRWWDVYETADDAPPILYEIEFHFCNDIVSPQLDVISPEFCEGDSVTIIINNAKDGDKFIWNFDEENDTTTLTSKTFFSEKLISVTRIDSFGCSSSSNSIKLNTLPLPDVPQITIEDNDLVTINGSYLYEWFKNDTLIADATTHILEPFGYGHYKVRITNEAGCSDESSSMLFTPVGLDELDNFKRIKLYPNPVTNNTLTVETSLDLPLTLSIYSLDGSFIHNYEIKENFSQIKINSIPIGTYIAKFGSHGTLIGTTKFVK